MPYAFAAAVKRGKNYTQRAAAAAFLETFPSPEVLAIFIPAVTPLPSLRSHPRISLLFWLAMSLQFEDHFRIPLIACFRLET